MVGLLSHTGSTTETGFTKIRFMPDAIGEWTYTTKSNRAELNGKTGQFTCIEPSDGNRGPVQVYKDFYLQYADGAPYHQFGTTCYAWAHQGDAMEEQTLKTLCRGTFQQDADVHLSKRLRLQQK